MIATIAVHCPGCRPTRIVSKEPHIGSECIQGLLYMAREIASSIYDHAYLGGWKPDHIVDEYFGISGLVAIPGFSPHSCANRRIRSSSPNLLVAVDVQIEHYNGAY